MGGRWSCTCSRNLLLLAVCRYLHRDASLPQRHRPVTTSLLSALLVLATSVPQRPGAFLPDAPSGTGLEWMTIMSVVVPALVVIGLVWAGSKQTV
jgi:hypothetical protein